MSKTTTQPDPLDAFTADPSPLTAINLAIADHKAASPLMDHEFLHQLHRAADQIEHRTEMVEALTDAHAMLRLMGVDMGAHEATRRITAALTKAQGVDRG